MRVLHVHSGNLYGGVETLLLTLARHRHLVPALEPHFALCFEGRLSEGLAAAGASIDLLGAARVRRPLSIRRARRALRDVLRRGPFGAVVCHSPWSQALFGPVARAAEVPLALWVHNPVTGRRWLERWARRTPPDLAICNSHFTANTVSILYPEALREVVYCPVTAQDAAVAGVDRAALRAPLQAAPEATVIVQVSRMEPWKGQSLHIEALSMLSHVPGWVCWLVGGAQRSAEHRYCERLKAMVAGRGLAERVRFLGHRSDVPRLLRAADIYCQPNAEPEPFGIALVEALLAGLPVVTTAVGGAREIVDDTCGILVPPQPAAVAAALRRLIEDVPLRRDLGAVGPARAINLCDPATQMARLARALGRVVCGRVAA